MIERFQAVPTVPRVLAGGLADDRCLVAYAAGAPLAVLVVSEVIGLRRTSAAIHVSADDLRELAGLLLEAAAAVDPAGRRWVAVRGLV